ncbi:ABC transporter permease [Mycolicibacterium sp. P9-64]|uniref:sugar ABC transporter permease n=1 Tax=Mycolicibacterium sp. P9-64 TaxID=2024612 RepID=UPI0011EFDF81|nr:ABC transporter permease [Mycolicibacterium sp. P9-64]KAA0083399.1 ABC transporter permease [Mycolicibacterium sp. P9-64]
MSIPTRTTGQVDRADFGGDTTDRSFASALSDYRARLKSGQLGTLPALFGLSVLIAMFAVSSPVFLSLANLANLLSQGAGRTIIAMGLVFVLLLGEIDVSAGAASGVTAAMLALHYVSNGNMLGAMGTPVFVAFIVVGLATVGLAIWMRIWAAALIGLIPPAILLLGIPANPWVEMLLAVSVGASIGTLSGFLVAKVRIPSFVITLALFLTWQGVILLLIGDGGVLGINTDPTLRAVANGNLNVGMSWLLYGTFVALFAGVQFTRHTRRSRRGLTTPPLSVVVIKVAAVVLLGATFTGLLTVNRSQNANLVIAGVPFVVPIVLTLLVAGTYVLDHTAYGRYIYAVGGNAEAARRAGIDVPKIRGSVFIVSASFAALGAIVYSSKVGSVDPTAGGLNTLLFAVGAAVIGGTSLFGGRGRVSNAVIGGLVLAVVENGLGLLNQPAAVVAIVTGLVLALAATVDALSRMRSTKA